MSFSERTADRAYFFAVHFAKANAGARSNVDRISEAARFSTLEQQDSGCFLYFDLLGFNALLTALC
jgi:hypothetical protein